MGTQKTAPLVSVIVPTYNRPAPLNLTLRSLAEQSFKELEVIVVNDAGEDVGEVIDKHRSNLDINYITQPSNSGQSAANNTGIKNARGKYLCVLNDDDLLGRDHIKRLFNTLENADGDFAYSDCHMVRVKWKDDGELEKLDYRPYAGGPFDRGKLMITNYIPIICAMFSRHAAQECGGFDEGLFHYEDWDLWIRFALKYEFIHVPHPSAQYLLHMSGTQNKSRADSYLNNITSREYIYAKYETVFTKNPILIQARTKFWHKLFNEKLQEEEFSPPSKPVHFNILYRLAANAKLDEKAETFARRWHKDFASTESLSALANLLSQSGREQEALKLLRTQQKQD